jgi:hypothetical protein
MRLSKQSAPYVDSYDITVTKDELRIIYDALTELAREADTEEVRKYHSVHLNDRKEQLYEDLTENAKIEQMRESIHHIKGLVD